MSEAGLQRQGVEAAHTAFYTAVESADLDLLGAVWLDGPRASDVVCVHPGWPTLRGRHSVLRSFAVICANTPYLQFFLTDVAVTVTGDMAVVTCVENILTGISRPTEAGADGRAPDGGGLAGGTAVATNVFLRTPGGWRLWVHHASPVLARNDDDDDEDDDEVDDEDGRLGGPRAGDGPG